LSLHNLIDFSALLLL